MASSLFNLSLGLDQEYEVWMNDLIKFSTMIIVAHLMGLYMVNGNFSGAFNKEVLNKVAGVLVGLSAYYLVVKKIVKVSNSEGYCNLH